MTDSYSRPLFVAYELLVLATVLYPPVDGKSHTFSMTSTKLMLTLYLPHQTVKFHIGQDCFHHTPEHIMDFVRSEMANPIFLKAAR